MFKVEKIKDIREKVNLDSSKIEEIVQDIIQPYCEELDRYVDFIKSILQDGNNPPTAPAIPAAADPSKIHPKQKTVHPKGSSPAYRP